MPQFPQLKIISRENIKGAKILVCYMLTGLDFNRTQKSYHWRNQSVHWPGRIPNPSTENCIKGKPKIAKKILACCTRSTERLDQSETLARALVKEGKVTEMSGEKTIEYKTSRRREMWEKGDEVLPIPWKIFCRPTLF